MNNGAFNKINQTHEFFQKIVAPLKLNLEMQFGYMIVFKDSNYYTIMEDLECLQQFVMNVKQSSIFCERNVTNYFDGEYNFTLWPKVPISSAMNMYNKHKIWSGITVPRLNDNYTELYWFTIDTTRTDWHKFFIRNKQLLLRFIKYFDTYKEILHLNKHNPQELFRFSKGFDIDLPKSEYIQEESPCIKKLITSLDLDPLFMRNIQTKTNLSKREIEVLSIICHGFTAKITAEKLNISTKTVQHHIENIKRKTGSHFKTDLIILYENLYNNDL